jgi:hypothetical protein
MWIMRPKESDFSPFAIYEPTKTSGGGHVQISRCREVVNRIVKIHLCNEIFSVSGFPSWYGQDVLPYLELTYLDLPGRNKIIRL